MKKILYLITVALVGLTSSCKKTEGLNPLADIGNLSVGAYLTLNANVNLNLNYAAISTSQVSIKVDQYLTPGTTSAGASDIDKINLYVVQSANANPSAWKKVKTVSYTGPGTVLSATGAEVAAALGVAPSALTPGTYYTFYNESVTKDGRTFNISNVNSNLESNSNYNASFRWTAYVVCPFVAPVAGTYKVITDDWADWSPGDLVQVTDGPGANQVNLSKVWPRDIYGTVVSPLVVNVDPATGTAKVPKTNFGNYGGGYNMTAQGANGSDVAGYIFSCTGYIGLSMTLKADGPSGNGANFGTNKLILQKQ